MPAEMPRPTGWVVVRRELDFGDDLPAEEWRIDLPFRVPAAAAVDALRGAGWEVLEVFEWMDKIKKEAVANSRYLKLDEGVTTVGILVKEQPEEEEKEWNGQKRKQYLFKVKWIIMPTGERIDFDEPKLLRASSKLAGAIVDALSRKVYDITGGDPNPEKVPDVLPVKIRREGTGSTTRYTVVG